MPTYEYRCKGCEHAFELFQSMTESPKKKCPACGKPKLERLFGTGAAILFKGSGFYLTDYRSESYKSAAKAEDSGAKEAAPAPTPPPAPEPKAKKAEPKKKREAS